MLLQAEFEDLVTKVKANASIEQNARDVREKYGPMFTPEGINALDPEKFRAFLRIDENKHWSGIHRWGGKLTSNLPLLKKALLVLVDESIPVANRIDDARRIIDGLGKAVISAVLQVAYPSEYGVYNSASDEGLQRIGMHPRDTVPGFDSLSTGQRYEHINRVLKGLSGTYDIRLWGLDTVLGALGHHEELVGPDAVPEASALADETLRGEIPTSRFGMERHLEEFLVDNWAQTPLATSLEIMVDKDGDSVGEQYPTSVGPIDLLCRNKDGSGYTVVELKRRQTNDDTVGQVARYMGWVKKNLLKEGQSVRGLIICPEADEKLMTALTVVPSIDVFTYTVSFTLSKKA